MSLNVTLYNRKCPRNMLNPAVGTSGNNGFVYHEVSTGVHTVTGSFREGDTPSVTNPDIVLQHPIGMMLGCNYVYIGGGGTIDFRRYYHVVEMVALTANTTLLRLHVDVLNSFWNDQWDSAKSSVALIARQETEHSDLLSDDFVRIGAGAVVDTYQIGSDSVSVARVVTVCGTL